MTGFSEKWIGGRYTGRQAAVVAGGVMVGIFLWLLLFFLPWWLRVPFEAPVAFFTLRLASEKRIRPYDLRYDQYLILRWRYKRKQKRFVWKGGGAR